MVPPVLTVTLIFCPGFKLLTPTAAFEPAGFGMTLTGSFVVTLNPFFGAGGAGVVLLVDFGEGSEFPSTTVTLIFCPGFKFSIPIFEDEPVAFGMIVTCLLGVGVGLGVAFGDAEGFGVALTVGFGVTDGFGDGNGDGFAVGVGDGEAEGDGVGLTVGVGVGAGEAVADGEGVGVGLALGDGVGVGVGEIGAEPPAIGAGALGLAETFVT